MCFSVALLINSKAPAQWSMPDQPEYKWLRLANEQYHQGHYATAIQSANKYLKGYRDNVSGHPHTADELAKYYIILSNLYLDNQSITDTAQQFINATANPVYKQRTAYALAQFYFRRNELANAIPYYELAGFENLSNQEIVNARFELAYSYFNNRQFDKAATLFGSIRELQGKYNTAGNYYYGLLAYNQGNYKDALRSFDKIKDEKEYRNIVPYYIAEIHYFSGNKKQALSDAQSLIKRSDKLYYHNELHLLAAQVLFEEQRYGEALPYFEEYYNNVSQIRKEDIYEMGYSYYRVNEWTHAIDKFKMLSSIQDTLGQTAMYLLGDCYLKLGDKKSARNAFSLCADMLFNPGQREASLYLSSKLSYDMGYQDDALNRIRTLLRDYPRTAYRDEARTILSDILIKTNNYNEAFSILQSVGSKDRLYWKVHQKVTYGYAMQQMQNDKLQMADSLLDLSLSHSEDNTYETAANFWKGEIAYRMQRYTDAITYTQRFISKAASDKVELKRLSPNATLQHAYLNMGYAALEQKDYATAQSYFSKAQQSSGSSEGLMQNAMLREADAVYMQKDYSRALSLYDKVITAGGSSTDYARFQKAMILGITSRNSEKLSILQSLMNETSSAYADDARYELAQVYIQNDQYQQAINTLEPLTRTSQKNTLAAKAYNSMAFAYMQLKQSDKAIAAYREVIQRYPSSEERQAALEAVKSYYLENNQPGVYAQLLKENNLAAAGDPAIDSAYYAAAETQFAAGRYDKAKQAMQEYLQQYPSGLFTTKANYYKAESHYQLGEYKDALTGYRAVLTQPWSDYTENSARKAASIAFNNKDYQTAANYYEMLRVSAMDQQTLHQAYYGLMESNYRLGNKELAVLYGDTLTSMPSVNESMVQDAQLYKARSLQQSGKLDEAMTLYQQLLSSRKSALATEAQYQVAAIYLAQDKLKEAEAAANKTIRIAGSNDYWIVKSYILLADVLTKQKDYFNAKATLQSIVKNAKDAGLKEEAAAKLQQVTELEKKESKLSD